MRPALINGAAGLVKTREGSFPAFPHLMTLDVAEGQIQGVRSIVNPDELRHLGPVADLGALLRGRS